MIAPSTGLSRRRLLAGAAGAATAVAGLDPAAGAAKAKTSKAPAFRDRVVSTPDAILAVREIGRGEPILMHPSLARGARDFDPLAVRLATAGYRVISFDPRGTGQSWASTSALEGRTLHDYAADVLAVVRALGLRKVHMLGHAYGNRVARTFAVDHPEFVQTVLLCACGGGIPNANALDGLAKIKNPATSAAEIRTATRSTFFAPGNDPTPWYTGWYPVGGEAESASVARTPFAPIESGGSRPMLIIQGNNDVVAPPSVGHALKAKYGSRITVVDIPDAGHAMIIEQTAKVASALTRYLAKHRIR